MRRSAGVLAAAVLGLSVAMVLAGCATKSAARLELTKKDSGSTQTLSVGQELRITLDSNPTTGYQWAVDGEVPPQLEQAGVPKYAARSGALGAGGTEVWTFSTVSSGEGPLELKYWRSFEPSATPAETFHVTVRVK